MRNFEKKEEVDLSGCGYEPIGSAPRGPEDSPGWSTLETPEAREAYTQTFFKLESEKLYAATHRGQIFLIKNPICWELREKKPGVWVKYRPRPIPLEDANTNQFTKKPSKVVQPKYQQMEF